MPVSFLVRLFLWLWLGAAFVAGHFLVLQQLPPIALPVLALLITATVTLLYFVLSPLRSWVDEVDVRLLVLIHAVRFFGLYVLSLHQRGIVPAALATSTVCDIVVATMALPVAFAPLSDAARQRAIVIWNVVGFIGLAFGLVTMARLSLSTPVTLRSFTRLPLSLVPTFVTPFLLTLHIILFARTRSAPNATA